MNLLNRTLAKLCVWSIALLVPAWHDAQAAFDKISTIPILVGGAGPHGIAFDGTQWHIANTASDIVSNYDGSFNHLSDITLPGFSDLRGLAYDSSTGNIFVGDLVPAVVRQATLSGGFVSSFTGTGTNSLNALAYDPVSNTLWLAYFSQGLIENRTKTGVLLSSFSDSSFQWTGLAVDAVHRTLLALETNDSVREYQFNGSSLGTVIPAGQIIGNGQGLAYNAATGTLYATAQIPNVITVFRDPARAIPEPATMVLLMMAAISLCLWRHRAA